jgi:hypothetical protein
MGAVMGDRIKLWLIKWNEAMQWGVIILFVALMYVLTGCASAPPEVITTPVPVELPVPTKGEPLPVCLVQLVPCHQPTITGRVQCIGHNVAELKRCDATNVATLEGHNRGINPANVDD